MSAAAPPAYSSPAFWEARYAACAAPFDWLAPWSLLAPPVCAALGPPHGQEVLLVGVGTSPLPAQLSSAGYTALTCIDVSPSAVEASVGAYGPSHPDADWAVMDARSLDDLGDGVFDAVLDKGLVDALMAGPDGAVDVTRMVAEAARVLKRGGVLLVVSHGGPETRNALLRGASNPRDPGLWKSVEVLTLEVALPGWEGGDRLVFVYTCRK